MIIKYNRKNLIVFERANVYKKKNGFERKFIVVKDKKKK